MNIGFRKVLLFSPHTDDCEFGMGGTILKLAQSGCDITWVICSNPIKSLPDEFEEDTLITEQKKSATRLGVDIGSLVFWDFEVRQFPAQRQEILERMVELGRQHNFDAVFCPSQNDWHQDHMTITNEVRRAFKKKTILGYDLPWNNFQSDHNLLIPLSRKEIEIKVKVLHTYESQMHRPYMNAEFLKSIARVRAAPLDCEYAEAFEVIRMVMDDLHYSRGNIEPYESASHGLETRNRCTET